MVRQRSSSQIVFDHIGLRWFNWETQGANLEDSSVEVHPNIGELYTKKVRELPALLTDDTTRPQAMDIIRSLIDRVVVTEGVERSKPDVLLVGGLAAILAFAQNNTATLISENGGRVLMVAGARKPRESLTVPIEL